MGFFVRAGLCTALALSVAALADPPAQSQTKTYEQWVALAEAGDASVDWTALRMAYTQSATYEFFGTSWLKMRDALLASGEKGDCTEKLRLADAILKIDYTYAVAHAVRQQCHRQRGELAQSDHAQAVFNGLTKSLQESGDGETPATAYIVVTQGEERFILVVLELRNVEQTRLTMGGYNYERVDGSNLETGLKRRVYFNIDAMFGSLTRKLGHDKQE